MKHVFICSPLRGDFEANQSRARGYARLAALQGFIPIVPHIYFTQFLEENTEEERALGIQMGIHFLERCDELWVFGDVISEGMQMEIDHWNLTLTDKPNVRLFTHEGVECANRCT